MATPQVPPRPARTQRPKSPANLTPQVPPRPAGRRLDRSQSPSRYEPSLLNDSAFGVPGSGGPTSPYGNNKYTTSSTSVDAPPRPPSVSLPSLGQEGNEYGDLEAHELAKEELSRVPADDTAEAGSHPLRRLPSSSSAHEKKLIGEEVPLHAPKPGLAQSDAKKRIAAVTRTESQASSLHKVPTASEDRPLKSRASGNLGRSASSLSTERPDSAALDEEGIPHIGRHVPLLHNAGDVQAPSPGPGRTRDYLPASVAASAAASAPNLQPASTASLPADVGQRAARHHTRTRSGREVFHNPPGSYGLHGHGVQATDKFEKAWLDKHPDAEHGQYSPALGNNRPEWALSSEELNQIVRGSGTPGIQQQIAGQPNEQIGHMAAEEFAQRIKKSRPSSLKAKSTDAVPTVDSPLKNTEFAGKEDLNEIAAKEEIPEHRLTRNEAGDVIHIDPPEDRYDEFTGYHPSESVDDLSQPGRPESAAGEEFRQPILASDEVTPGSEFQHAAVSPVNNERRNSAYQDELMNFTRRHSLGGSAGNSRSNSRPTSRPTSRPSSRPGSIHAGTPGHSKFDDREETPLEDLREYEPLFPDDEEGRKRAKAHAEWLASRQDHKRRFPSKDIWEDSPDHARLEAEVETPEPQRQAAKEGRPTVASAFETPEAEAARKGLSPTDGPDLKGRAAELRRPSQQQRFPSQDIWEDSPDSARLETTVNEPEEAELGAAAALVTAAAAGGALVGAAAATAEPTIPPRPSKQRGSDSGPHPQVPPRPGAKAAPAVPDRPKPQVPPRPQKQLSGDSGPPLTKTVSAGSTGSAGESAAGKPPPPATKPKPAGIPAHRMGTGKIAALQAGFMSDLNNRLKLGPQAAAPKKEEEKEEDGEPEEKAPLADARKGRARGPARRKPGASPAAAAAKEEPAAKKEKPRTKPVLSFSGVVTIWSTGPDGRIQLARKAMRAGDDEAEGKPLVVAEPQPAPVKTDNLTVEKEEDGGESGEDRFEDAEEGAGGAAAVASGETEAKKEEVEPGETAAHDQDLVSPKGAAVAAAGGEGVKAEE